MNYRTEPSNMSSHNSSESNSPKQHRKQINSITNAVGLMKVMSPLQKKSTFGSRAGSERPSVGYNKNMRQESIAQDWDGRSLHEMNNDSPQKEKIDTSFILFNQLPPEVQILSMACTEQNVFLLTIQGKVYSWGNPGESIGREAANKKDARIPTLIPDFEEIVQIAAGNDHVLALDIQGNVYAWGSNQHGQLGRNQNEVACTRPTQIEYFDEGIVQIYAGPACSFAVSKSGFLYAWGQNFYGQLGQMGQDAFVPQKIVNTPWSSDSDPVLVTGKTHVGYIYTNVSTTKVKAQSSGPANTHEFKMLDLKVKELEETVKQLRQSNKQLSETLVGDRPITKYERNFEEDTIIKQLKDDFKSTQEEVKFLTQKIEHLHNDVEGIESDLRSIKQQLNEIEKRENDLHDEIQSYENQIIKKDRNDRTIRDLERHKKTAEDLARANEQIKNMIQQKQNDREEKRLELANERDALIKRRNKLKDREKMVEMLVAERKAVIAQGAFAENKNQILIIIHKLSNIFKLAKETTIEELTRSMQNEKGLLDILSESNEQLNKFKKEVDNLKVHPNDALFDVVHKLLEMFHDDLNLRLKLNDYAYTVLLHLNEKLNDQDSSPSKKKGGDSKKVKTTSVSAYKEKYNMEARNKRGTLEASEGLTSVNTSPGYRKTAVTMPETGTPQRSSNKKISAFLQDNFQ